MGRRVLRRSWLTPARRQALYRLAAALGALAVAYGAVTQDLAALWLGVVHAGIALLADAHVPPTESETQ